MALSQQEVRILAQTLLGEAGGEGMQGMRAVAHVIRNRMGSSRFPNSAISVAKQPQQFSAWNAGEGGNNPGRYGPGSAGWNTAVQAINQVFNGNDQDITGGATHYWAPRGMPGGRDPYWANSETQNGRVRIGNQVFLPRSNSGNSALSAIQSATTGPSPGNPSNQLAFAPPEPQMRPQEQAPVPMPRLQRDPAPFGQYAPQSPSPPIPRRNQTAGDDIATVPFGQFGPQVPAGMTLPPQIDNPLNLPIPGTPGTAPPMPVPGAPPTPQFSNSPPPQIAAYGDAQMPMGSSDNLPPLTPMEQVYGRVFAGSNTPQPISPVGMPGPDSVDQVETPSALPQQIGVPNPNNQVAMPQPPISQPPPPPPPRNIFNTPQTGGLLGRLGLIPMQQGQHATGQPDRDYFERLGQNLPNRQDLLQRIGNALTNPQPANNGPRRFNPQTGKWEQA